ncbi:MAG: hypothetical protein E7624_08460 [Ruminococcaceae bacterium]|nr:hypothetical protein [Oscillospiraceae bacterium]
MSEPPFCGICALWKTKFSAYSFALHFTFPQGVESATLCKTRKNAKKRKKTAFSKKRLSRHAKNGSNGKDFHIFQAAFPPTFPKEISPT